MTGELARLARIREVSATGRTRVEALGRVNTRDQKADPLKQADKPISRSLKE
jgi:hypothetical protein